MEAVTATPEVVEERPATPTVQAISIAIRLRPFIAPTFRLTKVLCCWPDYYHAAREESNRTPSSWTLERIHGGTATWELRSPRMDSARRTNKRRGRGVSGAWGWWGGIGQLGAWRPPAGEVFDVSPWGQLVGGDLDDVADVDGLLWCPGRLRLERGVGVW